MTKFYASFILRHSALALALVFCADAAQAQIVIPGSAQPAQVDRRLREETPALDTSDPGLPQTMLEKPLTKAQEAALSKKQFVLKDVVIEGANTFSDAEIRETYDHLIGKKISMLDAQTIARKITAKYQQAGYVLTQAIVPQQEIRNGTLKIRVVEGYVDGVLINGDGLSESEKSRILSMAANIQNSRPVNTHAMERYLLLINDLPGITVRGVLRPSPSQVGAADLVLNVVQKRFEGLVSVDNRGSKYVGPWQSSASVTANSLLGLHDRTAVRLATASPTKELRSWEVQHEEMLGSHGTRLLLLASNTHTRPGDALKDVDIVGDTRLYEAKVTHPFIRTRRENLVGRALFDVNNSETDVFNNIEFTKDKVRAARIGGTYTFFDGWQANNSVDLMVSQGLDVMDASDNRAFSTNPLAPSDFTKFNLELSRVQPLPYKFSVLTAASGQYSLDPLLVGEQYSLGGSNYGLAYDPAEVLGDSGIAAKLELRYSDALDYKYLNAYQLFTYYDVGKAWLRNVPSVVNDKRSLASAGGGVRLSLTDAVSTSLEVDVPLTRPASNQGGHGKDPRFFFATTARF